MRPDIDSGRRWFPPQHLAPYLDRRHVVSLGGAGLVFLVVLNLADRFAAVREVLSDAANAAWLAAIVYCVFMAHQPPSK